MRIASALLCLFLLLLPATAASRDPTTAYLAARDRDIAELNVRPSDDPIYMRLYDADVADLERQIKAVIPSWHAPGFPAEGKINVGLDNQDLGFLTLDGLLYEVKGTQVIVTTPKLVRRWITDRNRLRQDNIPQPFDAAIRSDDFWTFAFVGDSGTFFFGEVPVEIPGGSGVVLLAVPTQTGIPDEGPKGLLVAVQRADRVFIVRQNLAATIPQQPDCKQLLWKPGSDEQRSRDFQACFSPYLHEQPRYDAIRKQAQALVDLLH